MPHNPNPTATIIGGIAGGIVLPACFLSPALVLACGAIMWGAVIYIIKEDEGG